MVFYGFLVLYFSNVRSSFFVRVVSPPTRTALPVSQKTPLGESMDFFSNFLMKRKEKKDFDP